MNITKGNDDVAVDSIIQNFNVGTRIQLRIQRGNGAVDHFSSLIGFVKDEFLMVKLPILRNSPFVFHDGEQIIVRVFTGVNIYSFATTVTRTFLSPLYYMHLEYPQTIDSSTLRSDLRVRVKRPASIEYIDLAGAKASAQATLSNLSISGGLISGGTPFTVDQQLQISFAVPSGDMERVVRARAIVRSANFTQASRDDDRKICSCGLQFQNLDPEDQAAIRLFTYETVLTNRQNIV